MDKLERPKATGKGRFPIPAGSTFGCLGVQTNVSANLPKHTNLEPGVFGLDRVPFDLEEFWVQQIGKAQATHFHESNFVILVKRDSPDTDNHSLQRIATTYYYALLIMGTAYSSQGLEVGGRRSRTGTIHQNSLTPLDSFHGPFHSNPPPVTRESLMASVGIAAGLKLIFFANEASSNYLRLRKGVNALLKGIMEDQAHTRLSYMVRSIEAIIRPSLDHLREDFVRRCQVFAGTSRATLNILKEIYALRLYADHIYPMSEAVSRWPKSQQEEVIGLRTYQAELLANYVLRQTLTDPVLLETLKTEDSVRRFWSRIENGGENSWRSPPIDLASIATRD